MDPADEAKVRSCIRVMADWPKAGVSFQDLSGVMADAEAFRLVIDALASHVDGAGVDLVVGIEARGFPYGAALAHHLGAGFVTMRKPGKLPGAVYAREYELEYGTATLELHEDAVGPGHRVAIIDDVLATGGTAGAAVDLVTRCGADVVALVVVMDLLFLGGRAALESRGVNVQAVLTELPA